MHSKANVVMAVLILALIATFMIGAYRVNQQAVQINELIRAQSPLIFTFENAPTTGGAVVTFVVTCIKADDAERYTCRTQQNRNGEQAR